MKARHYATHFDLHNNCAPRQLDLILVSQRLGTKITDAKVYQPCDSVITDHRAQRLCLCLLCPLTKKKEMASNSDDEPDSDASPKKKESVNYSLLHQDKEKCLTFQEKVDELLSELLPDDLDEATPVTII